MIRLSPSAKIGIAMVAAFVVLGIVGPWLAPYDPMHGVLAERFAGMSAAHWFGTDSKGVDTLSQMLYGARAALEISITTVAISSVIGVALGTIAGWYRGVVEEVVMRVVDILMAFPGILLNIAIVPTVARPGLAVMVAALSANG